MYNKMQTKKDKIKIKRSYNLENKKQFGKEKTSLRNIEQDQ